MRPHFGSRRMCTTTCARNIFPSYIFHVGWAHAPGKWPHAPTIIHMRPLPIFPCDMRPHTPPPCAWTLVGGVDLPLCGPPSSGIGF